MSSIRRINHVYRRPLSLRLFTDRVVFHHSAGSDVSAETIHGWHLERKTRDGVYWTGIGYHFVIRANGDIEEGRPIDMYGAHAGSTANGNSVGICVTGNLDNNRPTEAQIKSAVWLVTEVIFKRYGILRVEGHSDHMPTACPGRNFPMDRVRREIVAKEVIETMSKYFKDIRHKWQATHVDSLREKGIISGRTDDTFDPDSPISRAECAVVVNKAVEYILENMKGASR